MAWYDSIIMSPASELSGNAIWMGLPESYDNPFIDEAINAGNIAVDTVNGIGGNNSGGLAGMFGPNGWLGSNMMDVIGTIGSIGGGLANYFNGQNMLGLAKDQFNFQKQLANRNLANQAKIINNQYDSSAQVAAAMAGERGTTTDEKIRRYENNARSKHVDGSWVG